MKPLIAFIVGYIAVIVTAFISIYENFKNGRNN
jgi:hypothetical protein